MLHLDLFSGIGGFALAAERVWPDIEHIFCDNDLFCQSILKKHWPTSKIYGDIRTLTNTANTRIEEVRQGRQDEVFLLTGGFPCQPFSHAGRRKGTEDDRHLWPEMRRVIQEFSPRWVVGENVRGLLSIDGGLVFEQVCLDLEALGYEVQPFVIPACAVNAPHRRDRVWIVARNTKHDGCNGSQDGKSGSAGNNGDAERSNEIRESARSTMARDDASNTSRSGTRVEKQNTSGQERIYANTSEPTMVRQGDGTGDAKGIGAGIEGQWSEDWPTVATRLCRVDDGIPQRMDRAKRLKALGNAIVPQVAEQIFRQIEKMI